MRTIKLFLLKTYLKWGLFFYFRRIHIKGFEKIPTDQPTLILANHRNALIDALLIAVNLPSYGNFLTRASVFKKPLISKLLKGINMIPVYRIRDGWSTLTQNSSIFDQCIELLNEDNIVVIFPEGSHNLVRRVRPLSKGFTRIVFDFFEKYPDRKLQLVPLGLNFSLTTGFIDEASVIVGDPIEISHDPSRPRAERVKELRVDMHAAMSKLTVQVPEEGYDDIMKKLDGMPVDYLKPKEVNNCIENDFINCPSAEDGFSKRFRKLSKMLLILLYLPVYLSWKYKFQPKIIEKEFMATFRYAVAIVLAPIYLLLIFILSGIITGWLSALWILTAIILLTLLAIKL